MILLEREDVNRIGLNPYWFLVQWVPGSKDAMDADYAEMPSPGPFLLKVHDEAAWISHGGDNDWRKVAERTRTNGNGQLRYGMLVELYAEAAGLTRMSFLGRFASIRRQLRSTPGVWEDWTKVYRWPGGSDEVYSGIIHHPWLETREHLGQKEVRYVE
jgi:hypothetical protein